MMRVIPRMAGQSDTQPLRMLKISMASLAAPVYKAGPFEVCNQLADFPRH